VDDLVKERLTGAIILVALIVLLVPELLTGPVRPTARILGAAQPAEGPPLRSYTIKLDEEARALRALPAETDSPAPLVQVAPAAEPPAPQTATARAQTGVPAGTAPSAPAAPRAAAVSPSAAPVPQPAAPQATPVTVTESGGKGWMVQLGSFANHVNAQRLAQQLSGRGYQVSIVRGTSGRRLYRVLVGPTRDRSGALKLAARLRAAGHRGSIVPR
jgi:DedD protein